MSEPFDQLQVAPSQQSAGKKIAFAYSHSGTSLDISVLLSVT